MLQKYMNCTALIAFFSGMVLTLCFAVDYFEAISGDLSNFGLTPTPIGMLTTGSNQVIGTTGRGTNGLDLDYFTFNLPTGFQLVSLTELPGTTVGGTVSCIGIQAGNQLTVATNASTANGLLGWTHYDSSYADVDLLPRFGIASSGSSGFAPPLPSGAYSVWIQDFNAGTFNYGFHFRVQAVPEPGSVSLLLGAAVSGAEIVMYRRRRVKA